MGEGAAGQAPAQDREHGLQTVPDRVALPLQKGGYPGGGQLLLQLLPPVNQQQAPGAAGAKDPELNAPPGQLPAVCQKGGGAQTWGQPQAIKSADLMPARAGAPW